MKPTAATPFRKFRRLGLAFAVAAASLLESSNLQAQEAPQLVYPHTQYSDRMQALAKEFNAASNAPIIVVDRDLLSLNLSLRHIDDFDPPARAKLLAELAKAETGKDIDAKRLEQATYEMTNASPSTWPPGFGPSVNAPAPGFCTMFGQDPDHDGQTQLRDLMNIAGIDALAARPLINPLSRAVINDYTDYHELGHCFYYAPPFPDGAKADDVHFQRHKNETFGEIFATFMLARDGVTDFAQRYANVRLIAAAVAGVDDEYLHSTWDGLEAAQREVGARGADAFKRMTVKDIAALASRLTEENIIDIRTMRVAADFQHSNYDEAVLKDEVTKDPSLQTAADYALKLKTRMATALAATVDLKGLGPRDLEPLERLQYIRTQEVESADEAKGPTWQEITGRLKAELLSAAGEKPDAATLSQAFSAKKDALRRALDDGEAKHKQAMQDLSLLDRALRQAMDAIKPAKPGA